ncbi:hypothetical protein [Taklimakanibacter lacteus]|uniref:hypothetical protein n=1 Tax=Taklimakanibacter lacteus TaxID=2268456 RepID=UPI0013C4387E
MTATVSSASRHALPQIMRHAGSGSPLLWRSALVFLFLFIVLYAGTFIDGRLFNGVSVWEKPAKFFLSLSLQMATIAFGLALLPERERRAPAIKAASLIFLAAAIGEMIYIAFRAARGEASHFNETTTLNWLLYLLMGLGAATLAVTTSYFGWRILRRAPASALSFATGWGFILAGVLALIFGGYMSGQGSHWVGGDQSDATGLPFLHWSTTGGDLRVAHFFGLHVMQALPVLGFLLRDLPALQTRSLIWLAAVVWIGLTFAVFFQALAGRPFVAF